MTNSAMLEASNTSTHDGLTDVIGIYKGPGFHDAAGTGNGSPLRPRTPPRLSLTRN